MAVGEVFTHLGATEFTPSLLNHGQGAPANHLIMLSSATLTKATGSESGADQSAMLGFVATTTVLLLESENASLFQRRLFVSMNRATDE